MSKINALNNLSDTDINKLVLIKDTIYNRNRRYGDVTKRVWKQLYDAGHSVSEIASAYGASRHAVKCTVDSKYREAYAEYRSTVFHCSSNQETDYKHHLAEHKRKPSVAHLKTI